MISAGDFRNGITIEYENSVYQIIEFQHVKPGKGAAFVRTKLKNVKSSGVVEKSFRPTEKFPQARIDRKDMQYLYSDGDLYYFMDTESYEQIALGADAIGDTLKFVKENEMCKICSHNGSVFSVEPPLFVELEITETEPGFKGDTATGASKPAIVETGAQIYVPLFVDQGDKVKIDTRTGEYLSRV
ncbi:MAG: elongation factor P [Lachnospiraceae bacterium]|jgi:elongation factor P|nr:elongation factor P [Lachnospiraceae bacterium]